jgi:hypothetical protein
VTPEEEWARIKAAKFQHPDPHEMLEEMTGGELPEPETPEQAAWRAIVESGRGVYSGRLGDGATGTRDLAPPDMRRG